MNQITQERYGAYLTSLDTVLQPKWNTKEELFNGIEDEKRRIARHLKMASFLSPSIALTATQFTDSYGFRHLWLEDLPFVEDEFKGFKEFCFTKAGDYFPITIGSWKPTLMDILESQVKQKSGKPMLFSSLPIEIQKKLNKLNPSLDEFIIRANKFDNIGKFISDVDCQFSMGFGNLKPAVFDKKTLPPKVLEEIESTPTDDNNASEILIELKNGIEKGTYKDSSGTEHLLDSRTDFYNFLDNRYSNEKYYEQKEWIKHDCVDMAYQKNFFEINANAIMNFPFEAFHHPYIEYKRKYKKLEGIINSTTKNDGELNNYDIAITTNTDIYLDEIGFDFFVNRIKNNSTNCSVYIDALQKISKNNLEKDGKQLQKNLKAYIEGFLMKQLSEYYIEKGKDNLVYTEPVKKIIKIKEVSVNLTIKKIALDEICDAIITRYEGGDAGGTLLTGLIFGILATIIDAKEITQMLISPFGNSLFFTKKPFFRKKFKQFCMQLTEFGLSGI